MRLINEADIDILLSKLLGFGMVSASETFTMSVMSRIKNDIDTTVKVFNALSLRFIIGSSALMAASILFAVNTYIQFAVDVPEFAMYEFFSMLV